MHYLCNAKKEMMSKKGEEKIWFSMGCTSPQKELRVRDDARQYGLEAFVPLTYEVKTHRGQKHRVLVPALSRLLFIKGTLDEVKDYIAHAHYVVYIQKSTFSNKEEYLTVPTRAMENFIATTENNEEHVTYFRPEEISLQEGDKIRIKGGLYDGREGVIMHIKGKRNKHLVVQIPGFLAAAVELTPEMLELVEKPRITRTTRNQTQEELRERPSKDVEKDKKLLMETAQRLLFEISDKYQQENEYYLLLSELRRCRERLKTFRGYTSATEAQLALPLYLAAVILNDNAAQAEARLQAAIAALKPTSKLKKLCQEYIEKVKG